MSDPASLNRTVLEAVARRIEPLLAEVVFVGGQVAELLITLRRSDFADQASIT